MIGVLALQGGFARHLSLLHQLNVKAIAVRTPEQLAQCNRLIIPGGESTTMQTQIDFIGLREPLKQFFSEKKPVFGTCAGAILLSSLGFQQIDMDVERNGYGRQIASFQTTLNLRLDQKEKIPAVFIRAPIISRVGSEVQVLGEHQGNPVFVRQNHTLAATFHPELTDNLAAHRFFINIL